MKTLLLKIISVLLTLAVLTSLLGVLPMAVIALITLDVELFRFTFIMGLVAFFGPVLLHKLRRT